MGAESPSRITTGLHRDRGCVKEGENGGLFALFRPILSGSGRFLGLFRAWFGSVQSPFLGLKPPSAFFALPTPDRAGGRALREFWHLSGHPNPD